MKAYCFFSVHEQTFHRICARLRDYGVTEFSGFLWGRNQLDAIEHRDVAYESLVVFTRDLLPQSNDGRPPDLAWLARRERELGVSIQRMLAAERHLLAGRSFDQIMRMAEVALREIAAAYDRIRPDFVFSEAVSCFHSYVHYVLARERGIPFWCIGHGRLRGRLAIYSSASQRWDHVDHLYAEIRARGMTPDERDAAESYLAEGRTKPIEQRGNEVREKTGIDAAEIQRFGVATRHYLADPGDPTATAPWRALTQRLRRMARVRMVEARGLFESPVRGEDYILYPIHFQPEASTLVQAPMYLDQLALIQDIAKCLPVGFRLYVKEHAINRGRRPLAFYEAIRAIPAARLLGPDEDTWSLVQDARAIAVITGTMGWEGLMFEKPVITFGDVYFNVLPQVYRAGAAAKDAWHSLFVQATTAHRPDREALLALISAMQQTSYPGSIANAVRVPYVLNPENIARVTAALAQAAGLALGGAAAESRARPASSTT